MSAQILDASGTVLWEYPNFRSRILTYYPMINLQYPDFSEAEANLSPSANIKFKTLEGIKLTLEQKRKDLLLRETQESVVYGKQFDEILSFLKNDPAETKKKETAAPADNATQRPADKQDKIKKVQETQMTAAPAPVIEPAKVVVPEITRVPVLDTSRDSAPVIVPAEDAPQ